MTDSTTDPALVLLRAALTGLVEPSVVILGVAEVHGTGRIELG